ncbi:hypothetical protein GCM10010435_95410 [Winogradskya consettensis]|uniref:CBM6 domain-containing protein n=1 Tax=Winogradskya consettensis TaxID=113560 RepID=A0A919VYW0_9ACTN|nr:DUF1996 domain-containing protein [Actinoplanes consettensis]GIM83724.1 hypothetical protein Aco04nite_87970 [Actinoplanes consettensis]
MGKRTPRSLLSASLGVLLIAAGTVALTTGPAAAATVTVQAESYAAQSGAATEQTADTGGGLNVSYLAAGDWLRYDNVDLGPAGTLTVQARLASATGGNGAVELRTGSPTGPLLATFPVTATGGWQSWVTRTATATTHPTGAQTVFAVLQNPAGGDFVNLNWFTFGDGSAPAGWVTMDQARWNAQLAAFRALPTHPAPADAVRVSEFNAACHYSHSKPDDPIVFPGLPGASHMHSFLGNTSTNANTTTQSLLANAGTSCAPSTDLSAYWIPTLFEHGQAVEPSGVTVYYGSRLADPSATVPFPQGFRMIAGDARSQVPTPRGTVNQFYCAGPGGEIGRSADGNWPVCAPTADLVFQLVFPDCWDGIHLDSPDHKSHVRYIGGATCSGEFPVAIPNISFVIAYRTSGTTAGFELASKMASSMHGDVYLAWDNTALGQRVKDCVVQRAKCNTAGGF